MSEKVILTQEQADAIEQIIYRDAAVVEYVDGVEMGELRKLSLNNLIKALYIGYEVEPEYRLKDWIITKDGSIGQIVNFDSNQSFGLNTYIYNKSNNSYTTYKIVEQDEVARHATPSEAKKTKERRWWGKIGRKVNEYEIGDLALDPAGDIEVVTGFEAKAGNTKLFVELDDGWGYEVDEIKLICPVENRVDVNFNE